MRTNTILRILFFPFLLLMTVLNAEAQIPQVLLTSPPNGAVGVRPDIDRIYIVFDKAMIHASSPAECLITNNNWMSRGHEQWESNVISFPRDLYWGKELPLGAVVNITLNPPGSGSSCYRDTEGNLLPTYNYSFTVRQHSDDPPIEPQVVSTNPPDGSVGVSPYVSSVSIEFSKPMAASLTYNNFGFGPHSYQWSADKKTLTLTRTSATVPLPYGLQYGEQVLFLLNPDNGPKFRDTDGNVLEEYAYHFTIDGGKEAYYENLLNVDIIQVPADPEKGFYWPYYLSIPKSFTEQTVLLVAPNNSGYPSLRLIFHDIKAKELLYWQTNFATELNLPVIVPTFIRHYEVYDQLLPRDVLNPASQFEYNPPPHKQPMDDSMKRLDYQLLAMIEDAKERLRTSGIQIADKVFIMGFSASGCFTDRFTIINPEYIKGSAFQMDWPTAPVATWQDLNLPYPLGVYDLEPLTGHPFDLEAYRNVPQYIYVGDQDTNTAFMFEFLSPTDKEKFRQLLGEPNVYNWERLVVAKSLFESIGTAAEFKIYPGVGHYYTDQILSDIQAFFRRNKLTDSGSTPPLPPNPIAPASQSPISIIEPSDVASFNGCSYYARPAFQWNMTEQYKKLEIQFSKDKFASISLKVKVKPGNTAIAMNSNTWKKVLLIPGNEGGTIHWRIMGIKADKTTDYSSTYSLVINAPEAVTNPQLSHTSKSIITPPNLSWMTNCNNKFKAWFGNDPDFSKTGIKKKALTFTVKNPLDNEGLFTKTLTSGQWTAIRKVVGDIPGMPIYWYVESWDALKRYTRSEVISFTLTE